MVAHARVAVVGDIGGHSQVLWRLLTELGVRGDASSSTLGVAWRSVAMDVPAGLHIVQVGDLIHRGPDSAGVVLLAERLIGAGAWTQIVGNHEQLYVHRPVFQWPESLDPLAVDVLRALWHDERMTPAAMIVTDGGRHLVTHAGLTEGFWKHGLGAPEASADVLTSMHEAREDGALWHPGVMLTGVADHNAGPVWASAGLELYPSWRDARMPFSQVHGHSSAYQWDTHAWQTDRHVARRAVVDTHARHVTFDGGGHRIVGIDPQHGTSAAPVHAPLLLSDAHVLTTGDAVA